MKHITLVAAATVTAMAALGASTAVAQVSSAFTVPKRHVIPRTGFTGGFPFGVVREAPRHHDRRSRHHRGGQFGDGYLDYGYSYGDGDGYVDTIPMTDEPGFFSTNGSVTFDGSSPIYNYDRSYPYDWYRGQAATSAPTAEAAVRCQVQTVRDEGSARDVPVRVCRHS